MKADAQVCTTQQKRIVAGLQPGSPEGDMPQVELGHALLIHRLLRPFACDNYQKPGQTGLSPTCLQQNSILRSMHSGMPWSCSLLRLCTQGHDTCTADKTARETSSQAV